ncbi:MAG: phosphatidate cytidylyltransferase [Clostridia bacterium]|nr:phosphatidate cytidylyltransferase [Clostridia bacterium]
MWSKIRTRLISAIVLIALVLTALFLASEWVVALLVSGVTYVVMYELTKVFNLNRKRTLTAVNFVFATVFMAFGYIAPLKFIPIFVVLYIIALMTIAILDNERVSFSDVMTSVFLLFYSVALLMHLTFIRKSDNGIALLFLTLMGAYVTDSGAYFVGIFLGKHKLIEKVSPNKTVEGAIGGILAAVVSFIIYGVVVNHLGYDVNFLNLLILSVLCAVAAQLGDLSASVMKRSFQVKDFGHVIPGHGGIVDRVDSLMFVAPVVYHFVTFLPVIK